MVDENYEFVDDDATKNDYVNRLTSNSHMTIRNIKAAKSTHAKNKKVGLFNLFFTEALHNSILE